jgi:hypothetical protein
MKLLEENRGMLSNVGMDRIFWNPENNTQETKTEVHKWD